jgi:multiple sugar transport system permease protein
MAAVSQAGPASSGRRHMSDGTLVKLFIIPTLVLLILWNVFPLFYSLYLSFTRYSAIDNKPPDWRGTQNYVNILKDKNLWESFATTGRFAVLSVGIQTVIGFSLAMLLRNKFRGSGIITTLILIPMMLSPVVVGMFWKNIYNPGWGIFNYLLDPINPQRANDMLGNRATTMISAVIVDVWMWTPFVMLLCLSGLSAIPDYLYEAAAIDRASSWFQFRRITLPQVAPLLMIAILFRTIEALKAFDIMQGLTGGTNGTETVSIELYKLAFQGQVATGRASALAYIVLIIVICISNVYIRSLNRMKGE